MFEYRDTLDPLNKNLPLRDKLRAVHEVVQARFAFVERIAVAVYEPKTDLLKTYIDSSGEDRPLAHYQATLQDAPSLQDVLKSERPRVINDLKVFQASAHEHTRRILEQGYASSYTLPMYYNGVFFGFIFFNSYEKDAFQPEVLSHLDVFGHMISLLIIDELSAVRTLLAAVKTASDMTHQRDPETGGHLDRMSRYARLIANALAETYDLDDEYIEHVFMFSPLHDIGKIGIPDKILLKPGRLTDSEFEIMKSHASRGREIVDDILDNFGLEAFQDISLLRNIAEYHHEAINGTGYPKGLQGDDIPLEARVVAVADVFDALTSRRPYKEAWSNDESFETLRRLAGTKLDLDCVEALIMNREQVERIQAQFKEDPFG
jgi:HD-GYP domain-containing protein (c-di-GMP phosphodiesterase class II)